MNTRGTVKARHTPATPLQPYKNGSNQSSADSIAHKQKGGAVSRSLPFILNLPMAPQAERPPQDQLQPVVEPQLSHFRQVPLRTSVMLPHSPQGSPS